MKALSKRQQGGSLTSVDEERLGRISVSLFYAGKGWAES